MWHSYVGKRNYTTARAEWVAVKSRWGMSVGQAEPDALINLINMVVGCPAERIAYSRVR